MSTTLREMTTVLAALRYWQEFTSPLERAADEHFEAALDETTGYPVPHIAPLTDKEIDTLCARLFDMQRAYSAKEAK